MQNNSKKMIGISSLHIVLFSLHSIPHHSSVNNLVSYNSCNLWYLRLGHISNIGLHNISKSFPFITCNNNNVPCDSCHLAKQRKLHVPNSVSHSDVHFNIRHANLWGPFSTIPTL